MPPDLLWAIIAPMDLQGLLEQIEHDSQLARCITHWQHLPARPAQYAECPSGIDRRLMEALRQRGIERLYTHQASAVSAALRGQNVVVVGSWPIAFGDFGVSMPSAPIVVSVEDNGLLEWQIFFTHEGDLAEGDVADDADDMSDVEASEQTEDSAS